MLNIARVLSDARLIALRASASGGVPRWWEDVLSATPCRAPLHSDAAPAQAETGSAPQPEPSTAGLQAEASAASPVPPAPGRAAPGASGGGAAAALLDPALLPPGVEPAAVVLPRLVRKQQPKLWQLLEALEHIKASPSARFVETVEAHIRLRVDPRRGDQMVRGAAVLPHNIGKPVRICVFAEGDAAEEARAAGAHIVGDATLVASILETKGKALDFNRCLAHPDMMKHLVPLGKILGPKGLMPNPKVGTLTADLAGAIAATLRGRLEFKMDRTAIVHAPLGKVSFPVDALHANAGALLAALLAVKPEAIKGGLPKYVQSISVCSTMGRGLAVDMASLPAAMEAAAAAMPS